MQRLRLEGAVLSQQLQVAQRDHALGLVDARHARFVPAAKETLLRALHLHLRVRARRKRVSASARGAGGAAQIRARGSTPLRRA